jgi:ATP-dependent DNA ligase
MALRWAWLALAAFILFAAAHLDRLRSNDPAWLFEPKYDGFRGMVYLTRQSRSIYSKRGNRFSEFEDLRRRICAELPRREVILDGEVVAIDDEGRVSSGI